MLAMLRWMSSSDHSFVVALSKWDPCYALFGESQIIHAVHRKLQLVFCLFFFSRYCMASLLFYFWNKVGTVILWLDCCKIVRRHRNINIKTWKSILSFWYFPVKPVLLFPPCIFLFMNLFTLNTMNLSNCISGCLFPVSRYYICGWRLCVLVWIL